MSNECKKFTGAELKIGMTAERSKTLSLIHISELSMEGFCMEETTTRNSGLTIRKS